MMLKSKFATVNRVFHKHGLKGINEALQERLASYKHTAGDWWAGKLVEIRGNKVVIDGCAFSVNNQAISTSRKSEFLFNRYEEQERDALQKFLDPALPVVEFGGSIGVVACLTNKKLKHPQKHIVVEANPDIIPLLEENRDRNKCHFTVLHRVVAYESKKGIFYQDINFLGGRAQHAFSASANLNPVFSGMVAKSVEVPTVSLQEVIDTYGFERCTLICDIEGGEADLIAHEAELLREKVMTIIMETHEIFLGKELIEQMLLKLQVAGFALLHKKDDTCVFRNTVK